MGKSFTSLFIITHSAFCPVSYIKKKNKPTTQHNLSTYPVKAGQPPKAIFRLSRTSKEAGWKVSPCLWVRKHLCTAGLATCGHLGVPTLQAAVAFEGLGCRAVIPGRVPPGVPRVARTYQSPAEPALFAGLSNNQINPFWHKMSRGEAAPSRLLRALPPRRLRAEKGATPEVTSHRQISPAF